jgi:hypothetical protein
LKGSYDDNKRVSLIPNQNHSFGFTSDYFKEGQIDRNKFIENDIQPNDLIVIKINYDPILENLKVITAIINHNSSLFSKSNKTEQIDYRYTNCDNFWSAGFFSAYHVLKLSDIPNWNKNSELRVTIETSNNSIKRIPISIYRFSGNPYQYGVN